MKDSLIAVPDGWSQYAAIVNDRLIDWVWAANVVDAERYMHEKRMGWPEETIITNLTQLLCSI